MDWRSQAACLTEDPEMFFPIGNTGPAIPQIEAAKQVCRRCDVVETCLRWALDTGQDAGVWGGLSEDERRALKRRNQRARNGASSLSSRDTGEYVLAESTRVILEDARDQGLSVPAIAAAAGCGADTVHAILDGTRKRVRVTTAEAVRAADFGELVAAG